MFRQEISDMGLRISRCREPRAQGPEPKLYYLHFIKIPRHKYLGDLIV